MAPEVLLKEGYTGKYDVDLDKVAKAPDGGVLMMGFIRGRFNFAGITVDAANSDFSSEGFLIKFDAQGKAQWFKKYTALGSVSIDSDEAGNIYIIGRFASNPSSEPRFISCSVPADPDYTSSYYMTKLDPQGNCLWVKKVGTGNYSFIHSIAIAKSGNIIATGRGSGTLGTNSLTDNMFVASFNATGELGWVVQGSASVSSIGNSVALDDAENIYVSGSYNGSSISFGDNKTVAATSGMYVVKFNATGQCQWASNAGGYSLRPSPAGIVSDAVGNTYVSGITRKDSKFGDRVLSASINDPFFIAKYAPNGQCEWVKGSSGATGQLGGLVTLDKDNVYIGGSFSGTVSFGSLSIESTSHVSFMAAFKVSNGEENWLVKTKGAYARGLLKNRHGHLYLAGTLASAWTGYTNGIHIYLAQYATSANLVSGFVYEDVNGDGVFNTGDTPKPQTVVKINPGGMHAITDKAGKYTMYLAPGTYTIQVAQVPKYYAVVTEPLQVEFAGYGAIAEDKNFILTAPQPVEDGRITLSHNGRNRPGFESNFIINVKNLGTQTQSGEVKLILDRHYEYLESSPVATKAGQELVWNYTDLPVDGEKHITVKVKLPVATPLGTEVSVVASLITGGTDADLSNNSQSFEATVIGAYDPNDKAVSDHIFSPRQLADGEYLEYLVRFQNVGTAEAIFISIKDTLSNFLDISSFEMLDASHAYELRLTEQGALEWFFDDIDLPAEMYDEPGSHGFVKFRIKPKASLALGDEINNRAFIYFDYNEPIITNTVTTIIGKHRQEISFMAISDKTWGAVAFTLEAEANSGLPVSYEVVSGAATIVGNQLSFSSPGRVTIKAVQAGNTHYNIAPAIERTFCVLPAKPVITEDQAEPASSKILRSSSEHNNQWYKEGVAIEGATEKSYTVSRSGSYTVRVTYDDCSQESETMTVIATAKPVATTQALQVYPNPASNYVAIQYHGTLTNGKAELYNLLGVKVGEGAMELQGNIWQAKFDLSQLPAQVYVLRVCGTNLTVTRRLAKQ